MIIAILEDRKKFKKSMELPRFIPYIKIALPLNLPTVVHLGKGEGETSIDYIEFRFHRWIDEESKVALYKEK